MARIANVTTSGSASFAWRTSAFNRQQFVGPVGVAEAVAEAEERFAPVAVIPAITNQQSFLVVELASFGVAWSTGESVAHEESRSAACRRARRPKQPVGQRLAERLSREPHLHDSRDVVDPRHEHGHPRVDDHDRLRLRRGYAPDQLVLPPGSDNVSRS